MAALQARSTLFWPATADAVGLVGAVGMVPSKVVTLTELLAGESWPTASSAATV